MSNAPKADLRASLHKQREQKSATRGGVAETFRAAEPKGPVKKATYELPVELHRALHLHAVTSDVKMRELVIRYIEEGLKADGIDVHP